MTHTPGPWHTGAGNGEGSIFADNGCMRMEEGPTLYPIATVNKGWEDVEDEANARLVAAAPELLEALYECITQEGAVARKDADPVKLVRRLNAIDTICRAAIAKATTDGTR